MLLPPDVHPPATENVGIVGAGAAGLTAAILLADAAIQVEVLEKAEAPQTLGSGITLQGNALRIFRQLGVWEQIEAKGYGFSTLSLRAPDRAGTVIAVLEDIRTGGEDLPATLGMYRPDLTAILRERAERAGALISYGKTVTEITDDGGSVTVSTADGDNVRYDLLIGADGLHSAVRKAIGIGIEPVSTGMGIWRAFVERPEDVVRTDLTYGGPWNRGRTVIIGDAAHSCPPTVAQGAAMALEDAAVLAELLISADDITETLWKEFTDRRLDRAKAVVNASVQLGQWMLDGVRDADVPGLMHSLSTLVKEPA